MILQALTRYYETLAEKGVIAQPGWVAVKVSYVITLDDEGGVISVASVKEEVERGKKKYLQPRMMALPNPVKRTVGIAANFLCDNSTYMLGIDGKGNPKRAADSHKACVKLHYELLQDCNSAAAQALIAFFQSWNPDAAALHPAFLDCYEDIQSGANIVFRYAGKFLHDIPEIRQTWQRYYNEAGNGDKSPCLITGRVAPVAQLHPNIKGVYGAQSSGASLVSFNAPAFCSYNKDQGLNAPTSEYAAFAYGAALNYLLANQHNRIGDTTVLLWAENADQSYVDAMSAFFYGSDAKYTERELVDAMNKLAAGMAVNYDESLLNPDMPFYILGLSPNAARLSVRFFWTNNFGTMVSNVMEHYSRLEICRPSFDNMMYTPIWKLLAETVNPNSKDKSASPLLSGDMLRAIIQNTHYPAMIRNAIALRIRADRTVNRIRASIIKAYYLKNPHPDIPKEVLRVSLNQETTNEAYVLGRLFSVLEAIQCDANPGINSTIRDRYFNAACTTPVVVFPTLIGLAQNHLSKIRKQSVKLQVFHEQQLSSLLNMLGTDYPKHMNLAQQGSFQLGYYHQTCYRYMKKEEK